MADIALDPVSNYGAWKRTTFGAPEEAPQFITPEMAQKNREAALRAAALKNNALGLYNTQANQIQTELLGMNEEQSPEAKAQAEIQRRMAALQTGNESINRKIDQNIARMGLQNSAAGQFARANQDTLYGNQVADLNAQAPNLARTYFDDQQRRRAALVGQMNGIQNSAELPGIQFMNGGRASTPGWFQGALGGIGSIFGGMAGRNGATPKRKKQENVYGDTYDASQNRSDYEGSGKMYGGQVVG